MAHGLRGAAFANQLNRAVCLSNCAQLFNRKELAGFKFLPSFFMVGSFDSPDTPPPPNSRLRESCLATVAGRRTLEILTSPPCPHTLIRGHANAAV